MATQSNSWTNRLKNRIRRGRLVKIDLPEIDQAVVWVEFYDIPGSKRKALYKALAELEVDYAIYWPGEMDMFIDEEGELHE